MKTSSIKLLTSEVQNISVKELYLLIKRYMLSLQTIIFMSESLSGIY